MISYRPRAPLGMFVESLWWNGRTRASAMCEHVLPSGNAQLVIALHDESFAWAVDRRDDAHRWTGGIVHGPQSSYFLTGPKPRGITMGVSFRPGAAGALFGVSARELTERHVEIADVWGTGAEDLRERLAAAATPQAAFAVLEDALLARVRRPLLVHPAVAHALHAFAVESQKRVGEIRDETGYSAKHFIALFRASVGLTPKQYVRIRRFARVLRALAAGREGTTLCDLAAATGYADQSHLTREFRELAGITPTEYRPQTPASDHHHVAGGTRFPDMVR